ncbi:MAG: hypothetical protein CVV47_04540 [Spirochaetae bacterium HGW-Spirochaetae-3]|jgi:hypothetical protein|nr:MAG: hypothetical protein CVV47_04540 [Spirochaetae bacterium HGW-Spirochaetae-3]
MRNLRATIATLVAVLFISCAGEPKAPPDTLYGMIYDLDGAAVKGAVLSFGESFVCESDSNGRFFLDGLPRGYHKGVAEKPGFERVAFTLDFRGAADILYVKIPSKPQVLALAERAMKSAKWEEADAYIKRASAIEGEYYLQWFYAGVLAVRFPEANVDPRVVVRELERIVERGVRTEAIFLLIGDLQQYRLGDVGTALVSLRRIPERDRTAELRDRMATLEIASGSEAPVGH